MMYLYIIVFNRQCSALSIAFRACVTLLALGLLPFAIHPCESVRVSKCVHGPSYDLNLPVGGLRHGMSPFDESNYT